MHPPSEFSFGPFRLSVERRRLLEDGQPVRIGSRALDLLTLLVEHAGRVVGKEELMAKVWPGSVVEETSLRFHIATLRRLLGEGADGPRYIANISGRGYCFVAETRADEGGIVDDIAGGADVRGGGFGVVEAKEKTKAMSTSSAPPTPHNLPARLTRVVGREDEFRRLQALVPAERLVTLTGPGGMGKSAVALAFAGRVLGDFPNGVWFADLSSVLDPGQIAGAVSHALALRPTAQPDRPFLLVLDNCEHVITDVTALVATLMRELAGLHVLVTSRQALQLGGEVLVRLAPLAVPAPAEVQTAADALRHPAIQLFVERAAASEARFEFEDTHAPVVADICRRVDGMPFSIELVAAQVDALGVHGLLDRLDDGFPLLTQARRGVPERHRTLKNLLDWSFDTLAAPERALLKHASTFGDSFDQNALFKLLPCHPREGVLRSLSDLVSRSMVDVDVDAGPAGARYRLLETTRLYAATKPHSD